MNRNRFLSLRTALGALLVLAGLVTGARAQQATNDGHGLVGENYFSFTYLYTNIKDGPPDSFQGVGFRLNKTLAPSWDAIVTAGVTQSDRFFGLRAKSNDFSVGARYFVHQAWGTPFAEATMGGTWFDVGSSSTSSFVYAVSAGAEFVLTPQLSIAPLVGYSDATNFDDSGSAFFVLRTNCWISDRWSVRVNISFDKDSTGVGAGFAYKF